MSSDEREAIRRALAAGRLSVPDPATGYQRALSAACPADGQPAPVRRVVRGARGAITELTLRCSRCGREFTPAPEALHLR